ncbi:hypothetical protein [Planctomicrobium sp. SH664]
MAGTVHTGSNDKFRSGWDAIFQKKSSKSKTGSQAAPAAAAKKSKKK